MSEVPNFPALDKPIPFYKRVEPGEIIPRGINPNKFISQNGDEGLYYQDSIPVIPYNEDSILYFPLPQEFLDNAKPATLNLAEIMLQKADAELKRFEKAEELSVGQEEYERRRQLIKIETKGQFKIQQKTQSLGAQWTPQRDKLSVEWETINEREEQVIDAFIKDFFITKDGIENLRYAIEELKEFGVFSEEQLQRLLQQASERIKTDRLLKNAQKYSYKEGTSNLNTKENHVLISLVKASFLENDSANSEISSVARELLEFYWRHNADLYGSDEKNPLLALTYDMIFAARLAGNKQDFFNISGWVIDKSNEPQNKAQLSDQLHETAVESIIEGIAFAKKLKQKRVSMSQLSEAKYSKLLDEIVAEMDRTFIGKNYERYGGLKAAFHLLANYGFNTRYLYLESKEFTHKNADEVIRRSNNQLTTADIYELNQLSNMDATFENFQHDILTLNHLMMVYLDKKSFYEHKSLNIQIRKDFDPQKYYHNGLFNTDWTQFNSGVVKPALGRAIIMNGFWQQFPDTNTEMDSLAADNQELLSRIRDENIWFVATVGDRFSVKHNPDLSNHDISSLTIFPTNLLEGGFRLDFRTHSKDYKGQLIEVTLYIDREANVLDIDRYPLKLAQWAEEPFKKFILNRIDFITSGALGSKAMARRIREESQGDEEVREAIVKRRHHYRHLTSTSDRVYTLMSPEAVKHADFVMKKYGINIYDENIRRRQIGKLKANQVITFVRELESEGAEPNELVFQEDYRDFLKEDVQN